MMSGRFTLPLGYSPEMECRILELPFTQKRISMFILLPDETDGLASLERKITAENVKMLFTTLEVGNGPCRLSGRWGSPPFSQSVK